MNVWCSQEQIYNSEESKKKRFFSLCALIIIALFNFFSIQKVQNLSLL